MSDLPERCKSLRRQGVSLEMKATVQQFGFKHAECQRKFLPRIWESPQQLACHACQVEAEGLGAEGGVGLHRKTWKLNA